MVCCPADFAVQSWQQGVCVCGGGGGGGVLVWLSEIGKRRGHFWNNRTQAEDGRAAAEGERTLKRKVMKAQRREQSKEDAIWKPSELWDTASA